MRTARALAALITLGSLLAGCATGPKTSADLIEDKMIERKADFAQCYEQPHPYGTGGPQGLVRSHFLIGVDGKPYDVSVKESTLKDPRVEVCVAKVIRTIRFPTKINSGKGPIEVTYPFKFSNGE